MISGDPRPRRSLSRTVLHNTSSNLFKFAVVAVVTFVMTPVYLRALGDHDYGIWEIMGSIVGYLGLLELGLGPTIGRYIARANPWTDGTRWRQIYSTGVGLMTFAGLFVAGVFLGWSLIAPEVLASGPDQGQRYALFLQLMAIQVALSFPRIGLESALEGGQRYVVKNNVALAHTVFAAAFVYHYIEHWDPLLLLCTVNIIVSISKTTIFLWLLAPPGSGGKLPGPAHMNWPLAREMYGFGFKAFLQGLASTAENRTGVVIVGGLISPAMVPIYSIPLALLAKIRALISNFSHAFMPAFSALDASGHSAKMTSVFVESSRLLVGVLSLFCLGAVVLGPPFIALWVGPRYADHSEPILYLLTARLFVGALMPLGGRFMMAVGKHGILAKIAGARAICNVGLSVVLVFPFELPGVALGALLAALLVTPLEWRAVTRELEISLGQYFRLVVLPSLVPAMAFASVAVGAKYIVEISNWTEFLLVSLAAALAFAPVYLFVGLNSHNRARLWRLMVGVFPSRAG